MTKEIHLNPELRFRTSRSSGKGGQHVNKVETKVELLFDMVNSFILTDDQKKMVLKNLKSRIDEKGVLHIVSASERSQLMNKRKAMERFYSLLRKALQPPTVRIATKPSKVIAEKRLEKKKRISEKKKLRGKIRFIDTGN